MSTFTKNLQDHKPKHLIVLLLSVTISPFWGWMTPAFLVEGSFDGVLNRALGAGFAFLGIALATMPRWSWTLKHCVLINTFVLTGHYLFLCYMNDFHQIYVAGIYVVLIAMVSSIETKKSLLTFWLFVCVAGGTVYFHASPEVKPLFVWMGISTVMTVVAVTSYLRIEVENRLFKALVEKADQAKRAAEAIAQRDKQENLTRLVAGIAHEINTPLAVVVGTNTLLARDGANLKSIVDHRLPASQRACGKIARIVSDLHTVVFGAFTRRKEIWSVAKLVEEVQLKAMRDRPEFDGELMVQPISEGLEVEIDAISTTKALQSLVDNAILAAIDSAEKRVTLRYDENLMMLFISNTGERIPSEKTAVIFEPFYSERAVGKGTGLGLSVARSAMQSIDGEVYYLADEEETTFAVKFAA